jgi:Flp pilus assembly protein TadB
MPRSRTAERRRPARPKARPAGPLFIVLTLVVVVLLAANLIAFYALHPPPAVTLVVLIVLGLALFALGRYRRRTLER